MGSLPKIDDCSDFTEQKAIKYVNKVIDNLEKCEETSNSRYDLILRLSNTYFDFDDYLDKISDVFLHRNLIETLHKFHSCLWKSPKINYDTLNLLNVFLINFANCSKSIGLAIYNCEIFKSIIDICLDDNFMIEIGDKSINALLQNNMKILLNIVSDPGCKIKHKSTEFKRRLVEFIKASEEEDNFGMLSMLTLAYIVEENEVALLDEGSNTIRRLLAKVEFVLKSGVRSGGFPLVELMNGLKCISTNDNMKKRIMEEGGMDLFVKILDKNTESEVEPTLETIWHLSFSGELQQRLKDEYRIQDVIRQYRGHKNGTIRKSHDGIIWNVEKKADARKQESQKLRPSTSGESGTSFDVFISYAWGNKPKIQEIRDTLLTYDIRIWIDEDQMTGSTIEAMANGIENSSLFLVGVSSYYMKSANCRCEAEYAFQIKKPIIPLVMELRYKPHSWLGFIMGTKFYYEFSERRKAEDVVKDLVKSINVTLRADSGSHEEREIQPVFVKQRSERSPASSKDSKMKDQMKGWSCEEVAKWLKKSSLDGMKKRFVDVDGSLLSVMSEVRLQSPEYFNNTLRNEFGLKFVEVMKFHRALNDLIRS